MTRDSHGDGTNQLAATHLLYRHRDGDGAEFQSTRGICCFCGHVSEGVGADEAISHKYFSDYDLMQSDTGHVCAACAYCMDTRSLKQGHWIAHADGVEQPSTGDLLAHFRDLRADAFETPFAVHVTSSPIRSSHAYLWTPVNETPSPVTVAYDRQRVRIDDWDAFEELLVAIEDLRLSGFTFDELRSGEPRVGNLRTLGREAYQARDAVLDPHRRTARLELALTLSRSGDDQPRTNLNTDHSPLTHE